MTEISDFSGKAKALALIALAQILAHVLALAPTPSMALAQNLALSHIRDRPLALGLEARS